MSKQFAPIAGSFNSAITEKSGFLFLSRKQDRNSQGRDDGSGGSEDDGRGTMLGLIISCDFGTESCGIKNLTVSTLESRRSVSKNERRS